MTSGGENAVAPLSARRLGPADWPVLADAQVPGVLGAIAYGEFGRALGGTIASCGTRPVGGNAPTLDAWCSSGPLTHGRTGAVQWAHNRHWLFGTLELDEAAAGASLTLLATRAYRDVFETLAETGCGHLLRLWNYLPGINTDAGGVERYRQFNSGRQQAFLEAGRAVFEGAPAACALGTHDGPMRVRFLAGRRAAVPIENPRQTSAYHYPRDYGPHSPTFSRAALVDAGAGQVALLISGTSSIVGHASVHVGNVAAQAGETLANLQAVIDAARQRCTARFELAQASCTVYVRHAEDAARVRQVFDAAVGPQSPAARHAVVQQADICRADLQVEIEAHAFAPGALIP